MPRYDLFRIDYESPEWFDTAESLHEANAKAKRLGENSGCIALDQQTGEKLVIKPRGLGQSKHARERTKVE